MSKRLLFFWIKSLTYVTFFFCSEFICFSKYYRLVSNAIVFYFILLSLMKFFVLFLQLYCIRKSGYTGLVFTIRIRDCQDRRINQTWNNKNKSKLKENNANEKNHKECNNFFFVGFTEHLNFWSSPAASFTSVYLGLFYIFLHWAQ